VSVEVQTSIHSAHVHDIINTQRIGIKFTINGSGLVLRLTKCNLVDKCVANNY